MTNSFSQSLRPSYFPFPSKVTLWSHRFPKPHGYRLSRYAADVEFGASTVSGQPPVSRSRKSKQRRPTRQRREKGTEFPRTFHRGHSFRRSTVGRQGRPVKGFPARPRRKTNAVSLNARAQDFRQKLFQTSGRVGLRRPGQHPRFADDACPIAGVMAMLRRFPMRSQRPSLCI